MDSLSKQRQAHLKILSPGWLAWMPVLLNLLAYVEESEKGKGIECPANKIQWIAVTHMKSGHTL